MINTSTRKHPWLTFGCDLALGQPTDREATPHEMMFLPEYMKEAMASATIVGDTTERNLVRETNILPADDDTDEVTTTWLTPLACAILLLLMLLGVVGVEWKRATYCKWVDRLLFTVAGLGGCVLFFLSFISEHPCTSPNWNLLWMQPVHLLVLPLSFGKNAEKLFFITILLTLWRYRLCYWAECFSPNTLTRPLFRWQLHYGCGRFLI